MALGIHEDLIDSKSDDAVSQQSTINAPRRQLDGTPATKTIDFLKEHFGLKR